MRSGRADAKSRIAGNGMREGPGTRKETKGKRELQSGIYVQSKRCSNQYLREREIHEISFDRALPILANIR